MGTSIIPLPLRDGLNLRQQKQKGETIFILKDPETDEYYRFDEAQYQIISLFDGKKNIDEVVEEFNKTFKQYEYDKEDLESLYGDLESFKLLQRSKRENNIALVEKMKNDKRSKFLQAKGSLLLIRFHLVDPSKYFDKIIDSILFLWNPKVVKTMLGLMLLAFILVLFEYKRFAYDFERVFFNMHDNLAIFFIIWGISLVVIAFHECGHGLTCKYYGGEVKDMGFLLLVLQPCLYCNVNDAWLFDNKRQKIFVALAGVYTELMLAMISAYIWLFVDVGGLIGITVFVIMTMSTAQTLFFNLNPLVKFDGYYILSDYLEVPNLKQNSTSWFSWTLKTKLLRLDEPEPLVATPREKKIYLYYGAVSTCYMTMMLSTIAVLGYFYISENFGFWGIVLYLALVLKVVILLTVTWPKTIVNLLKAKCWDNGRYRYLAGGFSLLVVLSFIIHAPIEIEADCNVSNSTLIVRAPESGFIDYVGYGEDRQIIQATSAQYNSNSISQQEYSDAENSPNHQLFSLHSPEFEAEKQEHYNSLVSFNAELQRAQAENDTILVRQMLSKIELVEQKLSALNERMATMVISKPEGDWQVEGMPPYVMNGRYYQRGEELVTLTPRVTDRVIMELDQSDLGYIESGNPARILLKDGAYYKGEVSHIAPLAMIDGTERRFNIDIKIDNTNGVQIPDDLTCTSIIDGKTLPLWHHVWRPVKRLFRIELFI